jgi:predicted nucleic acid-binding protein
MVVLNNTILSVFKRLDETNLLKELLIGEVLLPTAVVEEYLEIGKESDLKGFTKIKVEGDLGYKLGKGESYEILLAKENSCIFVTDDKRARRFANDLGIATTGTLGIIITAVENDRLSKKKALELLDRIKH